MPCNHCLGIEKVFDARTARGDLLHYRRKGAPASTRVLVEELLRRGVEGRTVLDIGGGVGAVQHALLAAGAARATSVDASSAYLAAAREEAERRGLADRIESIHGDFVELAPGIGPADIVTLDRVLCCYPEMEALVSASAARARRLYGLVYPKDHRWIRAASALLNLVLRLRRSSFRVFVHATRRVEEILAAHGFRREVLRGNGPVWQVAIFSR